jgi:hypothetical protein
MVHVAVRLDFTSGGTITMPNIDAILTDAIEPRPLALG